MPEKRQRNQRRGGIKLRLKLNQRKKSVKQTKIQITKIRKRQEKPKYQDRSLTAAIQNAKVHAIRQQQQHINNEVTETSKAQVDNIQVEAVNQKEKNPPLLETAMVTSKGMAVQMDIDPTQKTKEDLKAADQENKATSINNKPQESQQSQNTIKSDAENARFVDATIEFEKMHEKPKVTIK